MKAAHLHFKRFLCTSLEDAPISLKLMTFLLIIRSLFESVIWFSTLFSSFEEYYVNKCFIHNLIGPSCAVIVFIFLSALAIGQNLITQALQSGMCWQLYLREVVDIFRWANTFSLTLNFLIKIINSSVIYSIHPFKRFYYDLNERQEISLTC